MRVSVYLSLCCFWLPFRKRLNSSWASLMINLILFPFLLGLFCWYAVSLPHQASTQLRSLRTCDPFILSVQPNIYFICSGCCCYYVSLGGLWILVCCGQNLGAGFFVELFQSDNEHTSESKELGSKESVSLCVCVSLSPWSSNWIK